MNIKLKMLGLFLLSILLLTNCKDDNEVSTSVQSIALSKKSITLTKGETEQLIATVLPAEEFDKTITWTSSDSSIATVDSKGLVTAIKPGKATITVTTKDGDKTASCIITVKEEVIKVTGVKLDKTEVTKIEGETEQLTATVLPEKASNKTVIWTSSDSNIATVDSKGLVTAVKTGKVTITVTTKDGDKIASCVVIVGQLFKITMTTAKAVGEKIKLQINAKEADKSGVWIDLNNNRKKDKGEALTKFGTKVEYEIEKQTVTLYGKVTSLITSFNNLTQLDVTPNTVLEILNCSSNQLPKLDVSKNTVLKYLDCSSNELSELDASKNSVLETLYCSDNVLSRLDVSKNTALEILNCSSNQLTELDVSKNTALEILNCLSNQLSQLDVSKNTSLKYLDCSSNGLVELDVSENYILETLNCSSNGFSELDISRNTSIKTLNCSSNPLTKLNIANGNNSYLSSLDATYCDSLTCIKIDQDFIPGPDWYKDETASWLNDGSECP